MAQGRLIVIEGLDSSGKETQSNLLYKKLLEKDENTVKVEFPNYKSESSALIKMYLAGEFGENAESVNPYAASSFYAVDRFATYKKNFEQKYLSGATIIADRYTTSNIIHQASKIKDETELEKYLAWIEDYEYNLLKLPKPDLVIFLDMPTEVAAELMRERANKADGSSKHDIHERDIEYLKNTYNTAIKMTKRFGWVRIPCSMDGKPRGIEEIHRDILNIIIRNA